MSGEMEIPVKNKEELDPKDTFIVSKLKYKIAIYTAILSFLGVVITGAYPVLDRYFTSEQKVMEKEVEKQQQITRIIDSINGEKGKKAIAETFTNMRIIYEQMDRMQWLLPNASSITIYSTHDSGGVPRSGSPLHVTILYQKSKQEMPSGREYWQGKVMPEGYFQLARLIYERDEYYVNDFTMFPNIYIKETKEDIDYNGIKAIFGKLIKITPTAVYYLTVSYNYENPIEETSPNVRNIARVYAAKFEKLIQSNSELR